MSWRIIRDSGTDALTLGHLADQAGVTKPVVYDHFGTRNGLLIALYEDFDARQAPIFDAALEGGEATLEGKARAIAAAYVDCVLLQGREIPDVLAALAGVPELEKTKREYQRGFMEKCRKILAPFTMDGIVPLAGLWGMLGSAEALSKAAVNNEISAEEAKNELARAIAAMVDR